MSEVKVKQFIWVNGREAIVAKVYDCQKVEIVYLDDRDRAINENAILNDGKWKFERAGPCGGYADQSERLSNCVSMLRSKRGKY